MEKSTKEVIIIAVSLMLLILMIVHVFNTVSKGVAATKAKIEQNHKDAVSRNGVTIEVYEDITLDSISGEGN